MRGKPARDRRRVDAAAVTGRQAAGGVFERESAIIRRERFKNFVDRIGFVAQGARAGRESAAARSAAIKPGGLELLGAAAFRGDLAAVAERAALRRFDRRAVVSGLGGGGHGDEPAEARSARGYARPEITVRVMNLQGGAGHEFARLRLRKAIRRKGLTG
jgi:hypothetical protein